MWEGGLRVPCLIRWLAKIPAGKTSDAILTSLEIFPSILTATGTQLAHDVVLDGFCMLPVLQGEDSPREAMFWQRQNQQAARLGNWKRVNIPGEERLFDLSRDVGSRTIWPANARKY
jgi:arylsulfatase A